MDYGLSRRIVCLIIPMDSTRGRYPLLVHVKRVSSCQTRGLEAKARAGMHLEKSVSVRMQLSLFTSLIHLLSQSKTICPGWTLLCIPETEFSGLR